MGLEQIQHWVMSYGPYAVLLGSAFDNTGFPFLFVIALGVAQAVGVPRHAMLVAAVAGSTVGDLVLYAVGRCFLRTERLSRGWIGRRLAPIVNAADRAMRRWGILALIFGRFVPYMGKAIPVLAGSCRMSWPRAALSAAIGSALLMGFYYLYADAAIAVATGGGSVVTIISFAVLTIAIALLWWANRSLRKRSGQAACRTGRY